MRFFSEQLSPAHRAEASLPTPLVTSVPSHLVAARSNSVGAKISPLSRPVDPQPVLPNDKKDALPRDLPPLPRYAKKFEKSNVLIIVHYDMACSVLIYNLFKFYLYVIFV